VTDERTGEREADGLTGLIELAERLGERCMALGIHVSTVESCTGGLVGHAITEIPGSSAYYVGGFVTYSDELKFQAVGVPHDVLSAHGAVSAQVAMAMATGGRQRTGADLAAAVTGIAGPDGGSPSKPVGLTYIAVADGVGVAVRRHVWPGDRSANKIASAEAAIELLLERIAAAAEGASAEGASAESDEPVASDRPVAADEPGGPAG
jgi:PncC family amidohydrolase